MSSTVREAVVEDTPGPTAYDVPRAFQAITAQPRQPPRSKNAQKRHSQFLTAAKRTFAGDVSIDTPGPGAYDVALRERPRGAAPIRDSRFHYETSKVPGPADYEVSTCLVSCHLHLCLSPSLFSYPLSSKIQCCEEPSTLH